MSHPIASSPAKSRKKSLKRVTAEVWQQLASDLAGLERLQSLQLGLLRQMRKQIAQIPGDREGAPARRDRSRD